MTPEEEKNMPRGQRIAVLKAEMEARLAALEGGDQYRYHGSDIKWIAAKLWDLENSEEPGVEQ